VLAAVESSDRNVCPPIPLSYSHVCVRADLRDQRIMNAAAKIQLDGTGEIAGSRRFTEKYGRLIEWCSCSPTIEASNAEVSITDRHAPDRLRRALRLW
jgi:hypothetical protein